MADNTEMAEEQSTGNEIGLDKRQRAGHDLNKDARQNGLTESRRGMFENESNGNEKGMEKRRRAGKDLNEDAKKDSLTENSGENVENESNGNENGQQKRQRDGNDNSEKAKKRGEQRIYAKEATVIVNVDNVEGVKAEDLIKAVADMIGQGNILVMRPRNNNEYELILENEEMCEDLMEGLMIKGVQCNVRKLQNKEYVVSFMHLPGYLDDNEILGKLESWQVVPITKLRRRVYPGTDIEDGTRYVRVRFPKEVASLPYSTKFETAEGSQYFRVMHSHQVKTCRLCMSSEHLLKECPEFKCYKCEELGHFARQCRAVRCPDCNDFINKCECWMEEEEGGVDNRVPRQMHERDDNAEERTNEEGIQTEKQQTTEREGEEATAEKQIIEETATENQEETAREKDTEWTQMEISESLDVLMDKEVNEEQRSTAQDSEREDDKMEGAGVMDRREKRFSRRRTLKVTPNIDNARKKKLKPQLTRENRFEVLRQGEEMD